MNADSNRASGRERYRASLEQTAKCLLFSESHFERRQAVHDLMALFSEITGIDIHTTGSEDAKDTFTGSGKALSPRGAILCLIDYARTSAFLKGVYAAIREAQKRFPDSAIHVLYAGCGPFAPLFIPLCTQFGADRIQFTLLDIHKKSLDAVKRILDVLGLSSYARELIECDAASYKHSGTKPVHIVVTETMQRALAKEPQAAITSNLVPQLCEGGILVPEKISLDASLADAKREQTFFPAEATESEIDEIQAKGGRSRIFIGNILELTAESSKDFALPRVQGGPSEPASLRAATLRLPRSVEKPYVILLLTTVKVFGSIVLQDYDSSLTYPIVLRDLDGAQAGARIEFSYSLGARPGLSHRVL